MTKKHIINKILAHIPDGQSIDLEVTVWADKCSYGIHALSRFGGKIFAYGRFCPADTSGEMITNREIEKFTLSEIKEIYAALPEAAAAIKWGDIFHDPDLLGSSEYRALVELCASTADVGNQMLGSDVDTQEPLYRSQLIRIESALTETISQAQALLAEIGKRKAVRLKRLYHGTDADFCSFRDGIMWFTPDREETFHQYRHDESKPWFIFHASLALANPADLSDDRVQSILADAGLDLDIGMLSMYSCEVVPLLERHGYDGLTVWMGNGRHYATFHAPQINVIEREVLPPSAMPHE